MGRGRRAEEPKLNFKKVLAFFIAIAVIVMFVISINAILKKGDDKERVSTIVKYFVTCTEDKWGVINNQGEVIIDNSYEEMIIIPDSNRDIFICTVEIDPETNKYTTKVIDKNAKPILKDFENVTPIQNFSDSEIWYEENVLKFEKDGKYGLIDFEGKELLAPEYDDIYALEGVSKTIVIKKDNKLGIYNNSAKEVAVETEYTEIETLTNTYDNGYVVKNEEGKFGLIGANKKVILEPIYEEIKNVYSSDMYVVKKDGKELVVNNKAETVYENTFDKIVDITGQNVVVEKDKKLGLIDMQGAIVIEPQYTKLIHCFADSYIAKKDNKYGIITSDGTTKVEFKYIGISYVKEANFFECETEEVETELMDSNYEVKLTGIVSEINEEKGYIRIRVADNYEYYNFKFEKKESKEVLTWNTLFLVKENGKYGFRNKAGELIVDCKYEDATEQNEFGYAAVKLGGKWGVLKSDGAMILEPTVDLEENLYIDFIGEWHLYKDLRLNIYTK